MIHFNGEGQEWAKVKTKALVLDLYCLVHPISYADRLLLNQVFSQFVWELPLPQAPQSRLLAIHLKKLYYFGNCYKCLCQKCGR